MFRPKNTNSKLSEKLFNTLRFQRNHVGFYEEVDYNPSPSYPQPTEVERSCVLSEFQTTLRLSAFSYTTQNNKQPMDCDGQLA